MTAKLLNIFLMALLAASPLFGAYSFKENSVLAEGKWIKIEIPESGLYSISYSQLSEMGFENPENVGVYGKGGLMMNLQMASSSQSKATGFPYDDDLSQVSSMHSNGNLIFWGEGTEAVELQPGTSANGNIPYFENYRQNIYSKTSYYFLSDIQTPKQFDVTEISASSYLSFKTGWGFTRHERDIEQNTTNSGKLFWGESFITDNAQMTWDAPITNPAQGTAHLSYQTYSGPGDHFTLKVNCNNRSGKTIDIANTYVSFFFPLNGKLSADPYKYAQPDTLRFDLLPMPSVKISIKAENIDAEFLNLDYWILTYPKQIYSNPLSPSAPSELYYFKGNKNSSYRLPLDSDLYALDLRDPQSPKVLTPLIYNSGYVGLRLRDEQVIPVVIFDPKREQKKISGWSEVTNNNLHGRLAEGAELLIITIPALRQYADRLADLHHQYDGINVIVATAEEVYNEFSGGVPDPMAYRAFAKMLYGNGLKNILLFGPSARNMLLEVEGETAMDRLIAIQHSYVKPDEPSVPAYDFYGIMRDNPAEATLHSENKEVGVGVLSCENAVECERIIRKIERYLSADDQAWIVNESLTIGGLGDEHLHDGQAIDTNDLIYKYSDTKGMAQNVLIIDAYGEEEAKKQFKTFLNQGKIFSLYYGHGSGDMIGYNPHFFTTGDLRNLKNPRQGIIYMGGCDFSSPDIRVRGIGESFVLDTDYGMVGAILSSRTAWSSQNKYLGDRLAEHWLCPKNRNISPTIGEIFAKAKSGSTALNHLSFVLACDPALRIPSPLAKLNIYTSQAASPGEKIIVKGTVTKDSGEKDTEFNGKIVLKLMEPAKTLPSHDYATHTWDAANQSSSSAVLNVPYESTLITAIESDVSNGEFEVDFVLPASVREFTGQTLNIKAGIFDKSRWLGGAGICSVTVKESENERNVDLSAPAVNCYYDNSRSLLQINILDDYAFSGDSSDLSLFIDDRKYAVTPDEASFQGSVTTAFSGYCDISSLTEGEHEAKITAFDKAGNKALATLRFVKTEIHAPLSITLESKATVDELSGEVNGIYEGILIFEIRDLEGKTVYTFSGSDESFTWNLCGADGNRLPTGYYKICVRTSVTNPLKYSDWTEFAIL